MKKKTIIAYLLIFALFLSACVYIPPVETQDGGTSPTSSSGARLGGIYGVKTGKYMYVSFEVGDITITGMALIDWTGDSAEAVIPDKVMDIPVVAIGVDYKSIKLFDESLERVILPETIQYIGCNVFTDCINLEQINLPSGIIVIDRSAFRNCTSLHSLDLPSTLTRIGHIAFSGCKNLTNLKLPEGIEYIGSQAFNDCPGLTEVCITTDMVIDNFTFSDALGLQKVTIQEGITKIPTFSGCKKLTELTIPSSVKVLGIIDWDNYSYGLPTISGTSITSIEIPEGVTHLGWGFFEGAPLESIILPSTLEETCHSTLDCDTLKAVYFRGTEEQFMESLYDEITAPIYFLSETQPTQEGNYWHYVDGKPVVW